jgi:ribosomal protein S13
LIKPEDFEKIIKSVEDGVEITVDEVRNLIDTIRQMDLQLLIGQNALNLAIENIHVIVPTLAQQIMERCGRTDKKIKKFVSELSAQNVLQFEASVQSYVVNALMEASRLLNITLNDLVGDIENIFGEDDADSSENI